MVIFKRGGIFQRSYIFINLGIEKRDKGLKEKDRLKVKKKETGKRE